MSEEQTQTSTPASIPTTPPKSNPYLIPIAIVIAGVCVAGAIVATQWHSGGKVVVPSGKTLEAAVAPVTAKDHVRGPKNPDVYLIEYSDYQCPFCERFHGTVEEVLKKYDGKVAWVYRHFPLELIHPSARPAAIASECVAELKGEDAFWSFTDTILTGDTQKKLSPETIEGIAIGLGIEKAAFDACIASGKYDNLIQSQLDNASELGGNGTPYSVLLTKKGDVIKFSGALPIDNVSLLVERALRSLQ